MARLTKSERIEAATEKARCISKLKKWLRPGRKVYTRFNYVSRSGLSRRFDVYLIVKGQLIRITYYVAKALERSLNDNGIEAYDPFNDLVYNLGRVLYPKGFKLAKNQRGRNGDTSGHDDDGGYAFQQEAI